MLNFRNIISVFALAFILASCTGTESHQNQINRYEFINNGADSFLLDSFDGSLWILKKYKNEKPYILVPVPKVTAKTGYQQLIDLLPSDEVFNPEQDQVKSVAKPAQNIDDRLDMLIKQHNAKKGRK